MEVVVGDVTRRRLLGPLRPVPAGSPQHRFSRSRRGRLRLATRTKRRKGLNGAGSAVAAQALILRGGR